MVQAALESDTIGKIWKYMRDLGEEESRSTLQVKLEILMGKAICRRIVVGTEGRAEWPVCPKQGEGRAWPREKSLKVCTGWEVSFTFPLEINKVTPVKQVRSDLHSERF